MESPHVELSSRNSKTELFHWNECAVLLSDLNTTCFVLELKFQLSIPLNLPYEFLRTFTLQFTFFNTNRLQGTFVKVGFYLSSRDRAE